MVECTHVAILSEDMASLSYTENCLSDFYSSFYKTSSKAKIQKTIIIWLQSNAEIKS